jgi:hypothetical protein
MRGTDNENVLMVGFGLVWLGMVSSRLDPLDSSANKMKTFGTKMLGTKLVGTFRNQTGWSL